MGIDMHILQMATLYTGYHINYHVLIFCLTPTSSMSRVHHPKLPPGLEPLLSVHLNLDRSLTGQYWMTVSVLELRFGEDPISNLIDQLVILPSRIGICGNSWYIRIMLMRLFWHTSLLLGPCSHVFGFVFPDLRP